MWDVLLGAVIGLGLWILIVSIYAYFRFFGIALIKWKTLDECPFLICAKTVNFLGVFSVFTFFQDDKFSLIKRDHIQKTAEASRWIRDFVQALLFERESNLAAYLFHRLTKTPIDTSRAFGSLLVCVLAFTKFT